MYEQVLSITDMQAVLLAANHPGVGFSPYLGIFH